MRSIGIFMGGTDAANACWRCARAARAAGIFAGDRDRHHLGNPNLAAFARQPPAMTAPASRSTRATSPPSSRATICRSAPAARNLERCCIGAPTLAVIVADNQRPVLLPLQTMGVLRVLTDAPSEAAIAAAARD